MMDRDTLTRQAAALIHPVILDADATDCGVCRAEAERVLDALGRLGYTIHPPAGDDAALAAGWDAALAEINAERAARGEAPGGYLGGARLVVDAADWLIGPDGIDPDVRDAVLSMSPFTAGALDGLTLAVREWRAARQLEEADRG